MKKFLQSVLCLVFVFAVTLHAQYPTTNPAYRATLANDVQVAPNQYEFDIWILHSGGGTPFELQAAQIGLTINKIIANGGTLSAVYIAGSSQFVTGQVPGAPTLGTVTGNPTLAVFRVAPKAALTPGSGTIVPFEGKRLGRFRVSTTAPVFSVGTVCYPFAWNFLTTSGRYPTKLSAWVDDGSLEATTARDITFEASHNSLLNPWCWPVELSSFTATVNKQDVMLKWETKTETNSQHFEVERANMMDNNKTFTKVGEVAASGNSNSTKYYSFIHNQVQSGRYFYRLKMVDIDGSHKLSDEIEVDVALPKEYAISQNYPNPFNPATRIDYQLPHDSKVIIELYGMTGERISNLVNEEAPAGYYTEEIDANKLNLSSGVYAYRIVVQNSSGDMFSQVKKLVLTK